MRTAMPSPHFLDDHPTIDASEVRQAATELARLIRRLEPGSPAALVLTHARRELDSLIRSAEPQVIGPFRVKTAA